MAQLVKKDTFMYEDTGSGLMLRRQVFAGQHVPDNYVAGDDTDSGAVDSDVDVPSTVMPASDYKHQIHEKSASSKKSAKSTEASKG